MQRKGITIRPSGILSPIRHACFVFWFLKLLFVYVVSVESNKTTHTFI